ncbi:MAG TPA: arylamine N-acetyltransferase [Terriglobales bacterium]|nr:arylamine N-acetyltransferase [Terriglobales bacterium]
MPGVPAYLERISYKGATTPNAANLRALHRAHMLAVPFENLDIKLGRKIICDESSVIHKIVEQRRGGFCYELNGAFSALLRELGFQVTLLSARVARQDGSYGPDFDHLTLRVDFDEPWLADVGFGDSFLVPLRLKVDIEQPQGRRNFRIIEEAGSFHMEMAEAAAEWKREYSFSLTRRQLSDFSGMCHYHQTSPQSSFTQKSICSMATPSGRITIADRKLIVTQDGERTESTLASEEEWRAALKEYFEIVLE